ncbi:hypothetical protein U732_74 [Clostridium argentinense CDC 2741]|uniref:Uncharacterized protein n=2 Tax=Clostridium argentinense TaxID=29341 RepID=A0A0C1TU93_9CLOT|nr:hypothetical protein [Clostridium argentinense]ARC83071.1 hypothetical protein RSJ17_00010 [Clostridium argentinense]KIE44334.1 hypothetical protein U732_74 [Clostridium argentinense CDC 2741]NFF41432.1 hypothetical protein [Clostridium argentinense]NFP52096.1 hypothetical protein [Clostridium argentinense]NFP74408.1 hypothetical protein [Clostridium argentinense]
MNKIELNKLYRKLKWISRILITLNSLILATSFGICMYYILHFMQIEIIDILKAIAIVFTPLISIYFAMYIHEMGHAIIYIKNALGYSIENIPSFLDFITHPLKSKPKCFPLGGEEELNNFKKNNPRDYLKGCFMGAHTVSIIYLLIMLFIYLHIKSNLAKAVIIAVLSFSSIIEIGFNIFLCEGNSDGARAKELVERLN